MKQIFGILMVWLPLWVWGQQTNFGGTIQGTETPGFTSQKNWIINPDFEKSASAVPVGVIASTTNIATRTTTVPIKGKGSLLFTASASAQTVDIQSYLWSMDATVVNKSCVAHFSYTGNGSQYNVRLTRNSVDITSPIQLADTSDATPVDIYFPCGDGTFRTNIRLTSTATGGSVKVDDVYMTLFNYATVQNSELYGTAKTPLTASCQWSRTSTGSDTMGAFGADPDCPDMTLTGGLKTIGSKSPGFILDQPGSYVVIATFTGRKDGSQSAAVRFALNEDDNGTQVQEAIFFGTTASNSVPVSLTLGFNKYDASNTVIRILGQTVSTANTVMIDASTADLTFTVIRMPLSAQKVVSASTSGWFIDGQIQGPNNPSMGTATVSAFTEITEGSMTFAPRVYSAPAGITCSGTNPAATPSTSSTTCSAGDESLGIAFNPPVTGLYQACVQGSVILNPGSGGSNSIRPVFQLFSTAPNSQTNIGTGGVRVMAQASNVAGTYIYPVNLCSYFQINSLDQVAIRLKYLQTVSGTVTTSAIAMDSTVQNLRWQIYPPQEIRNLPIMAGSVDYSPTVYADGTAGRNTVEFVSQGVTTGFTCGAEMVINSVSLRGTRIGKAYHLGFTINFDITSVGNYNESCTFPLSSIGFLSGKSVNQIQGSCFSNVNSASSPGSSVSSQATINGTDFQMQFFGQFVTQINRTCRGTVYIELN